MQSTRKPPTSEVALAAKPDWRSDPGSSVSRAASGRRDDRVEPEDDDEALSSSRVDVVNVDGPRGDLASSGMGSLRRELAKLHQQAAAVERSLDEQRRDRADALDRLERATERVLLLEGRLSGAEAEALSLRKMHEAALADLGTLRAERDDLLRAVEGAKAASADMAKLRKELEDERARAAGALRAVAKTESDLAEVKKRQFQGALRITDLESEISSLRDKLERAKKEITDAREAGRKAEADAAKAKEDNARDRATARDRIDLLERALDDARSAASRAESELEQLRAAREAEAQNAARELATVRAAEKQAQEDLAAARAAAQEAELRATSARAARAAMEDAVRRVREDVAAAFARITPTTSPVPPPLPVVGPVLHTPEVVSIPPEMVESLPPDAPSIPPAPLALTLDSEWPSVTPSAPPPEATPPADEAVASPASASVPPPMSSAQPAPPASVPAPLYASVPPQVHPSAPAARAEASVPPTPPPANGSVPPLTRRAASIFPPEEGGAAREDLLAKLVDPQHANDAAAELRNHPDWLRSMPPPAFVAALANVDYDSESAVFDLARAWEREPLCHAILASLRSDPDARVREHAAWLLKHLAAPSQWKAIADLAKSDEESVQTRRWLLEALDRLAAGRAIGWRELGDVASAVARHPDPTLRDGVVGILVSLDRSDEKRKLLLEILRADNDEGVIASAVNALASVLPIELDPAVVERLLGHPSPRVQRSVRELIERAKQAKH